ncbi:hypothetical protein TMPK1_14610 [Rhodospirillales bacterium TMPK1]|uniref:HTH cro/C1-type domain-containing protein n=1 Tax=Roseiterribacter gracilis TaxID=2812848 RepID=A0A8S8X914_9PROT|nr:hypothetical protein TMPK1_14610 [Rhodospirillales bacterium TMPK1]
MSDTAERAEHLFAQNLRRLRTEADLSQQDLADSTGIGKGRLSEYERGARSCNIGTLARLAEALDVPISAFFEEEKPARKRTK